MRLILTTIILAMLAQPVWAQTVFYCTITNLAEIDRNAITRLPSGRFTMSVDETKVSFASSDGYPMTEFLNLKVFDVVTTTWFGAVTMKLDHYEDGSPIAIVKFNSPDLYFTYVDFLDVFSFHASCEKF